MNPLLDPAGQLVIAHRGASGSAPENTLPAFELAAQEGAGAFELDVRLTADGVPVVIHDPTLERTTGIRDSVAGRALDDLREMDAGARFSPDGGRTFPYRGAGVRIPTLTEVLRAFPEMPLLLDIKEARAGEALSQVLLQEGAVDRCVLGAEDRAALALFRAAPFVRAALPQEIAALYWGTILRRAPSAASYRLLSVPARYRGLTVPTPGFVASARRIGCPVHVWTVNDPALARRLWGSGVAGIITNLPDRIGAVR